MTDQYDIQISNVSKSFTSGGKTIEVLKDISFSIKQGKVLCILGPSGCGKSTLLKILLGLIPNDSGEIFINPEKKKEIAYIQQQTMLLPWRNLLQNASLGLEIRGKLCEDSIERIQDAIDDFSLTGFEHCFPDELSGGMKQRVNIISALESRPQILFCDEPFASIDFVSRLQLSHIFKKRTVGNMTTIVVTHNIEEAIFLGDTVIVMSGRPGQIVATRTPKLTKHQDDAIACRELPEFQEMFKTLWNDLNIHHDKKAKN